MLLFPLSGLPTFCLCNEGTGSLLIAQRLRWQRFLPTIFARITLLVLVVYGLGESFLHRHLARQRVTKNTAECFCCCLAPEPVVQPGVMFGQRDGHPLAADWLIVNASHSLPFPLSICPSLCLPFFFFFAFNSSPNVLLDDCLISSIVSKALRWLLNILLLFQQIANNNFLLQVASGLFWKDASSTYRHLKAAAHIHANLNLLFSN